ncbi:MAG: AAA family ATPase [Planctomycetes bacterium]|nr:AAA family ATPase [Planctomycetota bacterium]
MCELVRHSGELVTKEQILRAVWPGTVVGDGVIKVCIREIRKALGDVPTSPRYIATMHRRGYRFIGQLAETRGAPSLGDVPKDPIAPHRLVGRDAALHRMQGWLRKALRGERQVVFITGEQGIGKTSIVEALLEQADAANVRVARGQCLEHYGSGEAYLPVLEALGRSCREPDGDHLIGLLRRHAPTWLVQLTSVISDAEREKLRREIIGATRERMIREMAEAVEVLTAEAPLALVLEDLHWSDASTVDLISSLAHRRETARLLVIGTFRPAELAARQHPLRPLVPELRMSRKCEELQLEFLSEASVALYLASRFPGSELPEELAQSVHRRTDGNPLFMVNVVDHLLAEGWIGEHDGHWRLNVELAELELSVPDDLRQVIEKQIGQLAPDEQRVLEAASVAGVDFAAAAVAYAVERDPIAVEEWCDGMARRHQFLRSAGVSEWPDGTVTARYAFIHSFHSNVLYHRISLARRIRLHQRIGERGETAYGERVGEIAAELAVHFEQARDYRKSIDHFLLAARNDARRFANREAIAQLTRALELTEWLPEPERADVRMDVLEQLGLIRRAMGDMLGSAGDFEALAACARERGKKDREVKALLYLPSVFYWVDRKRCLGSVDRVATLGRDLPDELLRAHTRGFCGHWNLHLRGWRAEDARACAEAIDAAENANDRALLSLHLVRYTFAQSLQAQYEPACRTAERGEKLALEVGDAFDYILSNFLRAWALRHLGRWGEMLEIVQRGVDMAEKNGHASWATLFRLELAHLHVEAFAFQQARELCEPVLEGARESHGTNGQILFHSLVMLGWAHLGLRSYEAAGRCFGEVERSIERDRSSVDWIIHFPLYDGLARYGLALGDVARARRAAQRLCELAEEPGERTYQALGHRTLAEIAMRKRSWAVAESELDQAIAAVESGAAPLARWRVYATAAELHRKRRHIAAADSFREKSAIVVAALAESLGDHPLRHHFTSHPSVKALLE